MLQISRMPLLKQLNQQFDSERITKHESVNETVACHKSSLPMSFKGMILLEVWKKTHQRKSVLQYCQFSSTYQKSQAQQKQKEKYLIRWQFACSKDKIISETINNILSQQTISKNSLFYRLKKLVKDQKQRQHEMLRIESVTQKNHTYKKTESQGIQAKPMFRDAEINTATILENPQNYEAQKEPSEEKLKERKEQKMRVKMKVKDGLIERIEAQMSRQFKKLDKIIHKVNEIQNLTT